MPLPSMVNVNLEMMKARVLGSPRGDDVDFETFGWRTLLLENVDDVTAAHVPIALSSVSTGDGADFDLPSMRCVRSS